MSKVKANGMTAYIYDHPCQRIADINEFLESGLYVFQTGVTTNLPESFPWFGFLEVFTRESVPITIQRAFGESGMWIRTGNPSKGWGKWLKLNHTELIGGGELLVVLFGLLGKCQCQ